MCQNACTVGWGVSVWLAGYRIYGREGVGSAPARRPPARRPPAPQWPVARGLSRVSDSRVPRARLFVSHQRSERSSKRLLVFAGIEYFSDLP